MTYSGYVELTFSCANLPSVDLLSKSDPFILLYQTNADNTLRVPVGSTEVIMNNEDPSFEQPIHILHYIPTHQIHTRYYIEIKDHDAGYSKFNDRAYKNELLGTAAFSLHEIMNNPSKCCQYPLYLFSKNQKVFANKGKALVQITARPIEGGWSPQSTAFLSFTYNLQAIEGFKAEDDSCMTYVQLLRVNQSPSSPPTSPLASKQLNVLPKLTPTSLPQAKYTLIAQTPIQSSNFRTSKINNSALTSKSLFFASLGINLSQLSANNWQNSFIFRIIQVNAVSNTLSSILHEKNFEFGKRVLATVQCSLWDLYEMLAFDYAKKNHPVDVEEVSICKSDTLPLQSSLNNTFNLDACDIRGDKDKEQMGSQSELIPVLSVPSSASTCRISIPSSRHETSIHSPSHCTTTQSKSIFPNSSSFQELDRSCFHNSPSCLSSSLSYSITNSSFSLNGPALLHPTTQLPIIFFHKFRYRPSPLYKHSPTDEIPGINSSSADISFEAYLNREFALSWSIGVNNHLNFDLSMTNPKSYHYLNPKILNEDDLGLLKSKYVLPYNYSNSNDANTSSSPCFDKMVSITTEKKLFSLNPYLNRLPSLRQLPGFNIGLDNTSDITIPREQVATLISTEQIQALGLSNLYVSSLSTIIPFFQLYFPGLHVQPFQSIGVPVVDIFNERKIQPKGALFGFEDLSDSILYTTAPEVITLYIQQIAKLNGILKLNPTTLVTISNDKSKLNDPSMANIIAVQSKKQPFLASSVIIPHFSQVNQRFHISLVFTYSHAAAAEIELKQLECTGKPHIIIVFILDDGRDCELHFTTRNGLKFEEKAKLEAKFGIQQFYTSPFLDCTVDGGDLGHILTSPLKPLVIEVSYSFYQSLDHRNGFNQVDEQEQWLFHQIIVKVKQYMVEFLLSKNILPH